ncbi:MAG: hypothetical protein IJ124_06000 [Clostridia bacterium]|nr:hypothetical protein [Clostridia bacterium]
MIHGITITLLERAQNGVDEYGSPVYKETAVAVPGVLVGEPKTGELPSPLESAGRWVAYTLALPKGDAHSWEGNRVVLPEPFSGMYRVIGIPTAGIEQNIPLKWNKKVQVQRWVFGVNTADNLVLLAEDPGAHGIFDPAEETERPVSATLERIEMDSGMESGDHRLRETYVLALRAGGYRGEKLCVFRGRRCGVVGAEVYAEYTELRIREATVDA